MYFTDHELENIFFGIYLDNSSSILEFCNLYLESRTFNNISILLDPCHVPSLKPKDLYRKIVIEGKGGYCFEHNLLIHYGLLDLGFDSLIRLSRVTYGRSGDFPLTHICLIIKLEEQRFVLDLGFGVYNFKGPLPLNDEKMICEQDTFIAKTNTQFIDVITYRDNKPFTLYQIEDFCIPFSNVVLSNFYACQSQNSKFTQDLIVSRHLKNKKYFIHNRVFSIVKKGQRSDTRINNANHLLKILKKYFSISLTTKESKILINKITKENI